MKHTPDRLTRVYFKIKAQLDERRAEFQKVESSLKEQLEVVKGALLEHCKEHEVDSVRTQHGTFFRQVRTDYWTSDWESMYEFIQENNAPELLSQRLHQTNLKQFLEEHPDLKPKGLNIDRKYVVSVRRPTKRKTSNE